jgi:class 3 adenylate cyclase/CHASE2 domain-containing sensor protein
VTRRRSLSKIAELLNSRRLTHALVWCIITLFAAGATQLLSTSRLFQLLSLKAYDAHFVLRGKTATEGIVLIGADEKALNTFPELEALWHPYYAQAIRGAELGGAKVVAMDVAFGIPVEKWAPGNDRVLADAVTAARIPVVIGFIPNLLAKQKDWPIPVNMIASALGLSGYANLTVDADEFVRRQELLEAAPDGAATDAPPAKSFALKIAEKALGQEAVLSGGRLTLGGKVIPTSEERVIRINYAGPADTFPRVSLADFIAATRAGKTQQLKDWVGGKIVLIGPDSIDDRYPTPFYTVFQGLKWTTAGVEIHANTLHTILTGNYILTAPQWLRVTVLLVIAFLTFGAATGLRSRLVAGSAIAILGAALVGSHIFFLSGYTLPTADLAGCWLLSLVPSIGYRFVTAEQRGDHFRRAVTMFVGKHVATSLDNSRDIALSGTRQFVTILFTDIRGFTSFCEDKDPSVVVDLLNDYMRQMVSIIIKHRGSVNKFIGDGILAIFSDEEGAELGNHPQRAVNCALEMVTAPNQFETGAGVHTGLAVVGNVGSEDKMEYTVLGDTVNVASRLESLNKEKKTKLLMSRATQVFLAGEIPVTRLGAVPVRGQAEPIEIYTVSSLVPADFAAPVL